MVQQNKKPPLHSKAFIKGIIKHIDQLPAPPAVATKILNMAMDELSDISQISRLIESDQAIALKVLKMANSSAYGMQNRVTNIEQATVVLGLSTLKHSLLGVFIRDALLAEPQKGDPLLVHIWKHSLACAVASQLLAKKLAPKLKDTAFVAGLVHDCGKLVMLAAMPDTYERILNENNAGALLTREQEEFGIDHTIVGKWVTQKWNLPREIVDAVWLHHQPAQALVELNKGYLLPIVALGNLLARETMVDYVRPDFLQERDNLARVLKLKPDVIEDIKFNIAGEYAARADIFELDNDVAAFYFEALQRANSKLVSLNTDLERNYDTLDKSTRILKVVAEAGPLTSGAASIDQVTDVAVQLLRDRLNIESGLIYGIDDLNLMIEGKCWQNYGPAQRVKCPLDEDLEPLMDDQDCQTPKNVRHLIRDYKTRIPLPPIDSPMIGFAAPFYFEPLVYQGRFLGELMFKLGPGQSDRFQPQEKPGLSQLANLIAASINGLYLRGGLEERAEKLSAAMQKMKQITNKLLQTERLAAVGQLAAGAAHEINNPLAIIYARAQILESKEKDEEKKKVFQQMMSQIERISSILTNLMDFARPSPPKLEPTRINDVIEQTVALVQGKLKKQDIFITKDLDHELPQVLADPRQIEQVLLNLIINAEHSMEEKGGEIGVSTALDREKNRAVITVADQGMGISKENLDKIFDPFFTTKEQGKGTGLGLSTSYAIVSNHQGEIKIKSKIGKGTQVIVSLPLDPKHAVLPEEQPQPEPEPEPEPETRESILVVDDEKYIREILKEALESEGFKVVTASNGQEGLQKLTRGGKYRLLILDIRMPILGGLSLLQKIKNQVRGMPVIVLTGLASREEMERATELGASKCLRKPFQIDSLIKDIKEVLEDTERPSVSRDS